MFDKSVKSVLIVLIPTNTGVREMANPTVSRNVAGVHFRFSFWSIEILTFSLFASMTTHFAFCYKEKEKEKIAVICSKVIQKQ